MSNSTIKSKEDKPKNKINKEDEALIHNFNKSLHLSGSDSKQSSRASNEKIESENDEVQSSTSNSDNDSEQSSQTSNKEIELENDEVQSSDSDDTNIEPDQDVTSSRKVQLTQKSSSIQTSPMKKKDKRSGANKTPGRESTLTSKRFFQESKGQQKFIKQINPLFAEVTSLAALWAKIKDYFDKPNSTEPTEDEIKKIYPTSKGRHQHLNQKF